MLSVRVKLGYRGTRADAEREFFDYRVSLRVEDFGR